MSRAPFVCGALMLLLLIAGCGGSSDESTSGTPPTSGAHDPTTTLERAARRAVAENFRLSQYVGWHGRVPSWATRSTRGAALSEMRASVRENVRAGVRVRFVSSDLKISTVQIDPSYERATATVSADQRVRVYREGRRQPVLRANTERARIELRRVGDDERPRFVVWRVRVL
jgi:hypothetical protein